MYFANKQSSVAHKKLAFNSNSVSLVWTIASAISSSSDLERMFSTLGFINGKFKAQLGVEKARKLFSIINKNFAF